MEYRYQAGDAVRVVRIEREGDTYRVRVDEGEESEVRLASMQGATLELDLFGTRRGVHVIRDGVQRTVAIGSDVYEFVAVERGGAPRASPDASAGDLTAQMPGQVIAVAVAPGDTVMRGQTLVVLEAMKMEIKVAAPQAGRVLKIAVKPGQVVDRGQTLIELIED